MTADTLEPTRMLYSVQEFCRRNSIRPNTFYKLVHAGAIKPVKVGTRTLIPAASERAWHESLAAAEGKK